VPLTYQDGEPFPGVIGRDLTTSTPAWPVGPKAPAGARNILLVILDDVGFAQLGCYGSDLATPNIDRLAAEGLRYRSYHTTAMCSPTRAAILTGRNPHTVGIGGITELASGFPGYSGRWADRCGSIAEVLKQAGWATMAIGKWHLCPADEVHAAAPRNRWPLGRGFEQFFGFLGPETSQWAPEIVIDNTMHRQHESTERHFSEQLADETIRRIDDLRQADPDKPFLCYLAFGAAHAPHQVAPEWIERYRGQFNDGWDLWRERTFARQLASGLIAPTASLAPRPRWIPAWDSLDADSKRVAARMMEVYGAFLTHADHQLGRVIDHLRTTGELERTLVMVSSDNGASAEGGPDGTFNGAFLYNGLPHDKAATLAHIDDLGGPQSFANYPWGWAYAGNTPFRRWKRETHEGGIGDPLIVRAPGMVDAGAIRSQYVHAVDLGATMLDVCGLQMPMVLNGVEQTPVAGQSIAASFHDTSAPGRALQYYEQFGCRAIYCDGWKLVAYHPLFAYEPGDDPFRPFSEDHWELYDVTVDPGECNDVAAQHRERVAELAELWWSEAATHGALPLHGFRGPIGARLPQRQRVELRQGAHPISETSAPSTKRSNHRLIVDLTCSEQANGVLIAQGGRFAGFSLYVIDGIATYAYNYYGTATTIVRAAAQLASGRHNVAVEAVVATDGSMTIALVIDGELAASGSVALTVLSRFALTGEGLSCGYDDGTAVTHEYDAPFEFTGTIHRAVLDAAPTEPNLADELRHAWQVQ
jgi:arylsulfatase A-like enzyme